VDHATLEGLRRRLELGVAALLGRHFTIESAADASGPPWFSRMLRTAPVAARGVRHAVPSTDGVTLRLPSRMSPEWTEADASWFRVLALVQAVRAQRGAGAWAPSRDSAMERMAHDLFLLWDARVTVLDVAARAPGLAGALRALTAVARQARPHAAQLRAAERRIETVICALLADPLARPASDWPADDAPATEVALWARATSATQLQSARGGYRGVAPVLLWGTLDPWVAGGADAGGSTERGADITELPAPTVATQRPTRRGRHVRQSRQNDPVHAHVAAPDGSLPSPDPRATVDDPRGVATSDAGVSDHGQRADADRSRAMRRADEATTLPCVEYEEWDTQQHRMRPECARVLLVPPDWRADQGVTWARRAVREQVGVVRRIRRVFEMLQPRREQQRNASDGAILDLDATVRAAVERRLGVVPSDRLHIAIRPARRPVAIVVLIDISGSTHARIEGSDQRVIDVARTAALHAAEALDALGDPYAILAFSSLGRRHVEVEQLKGFSERGLGRVRSRIGALEPRGNTRLGAAVRHATALLRVQATTHRLLLVVTDGKPYDTDGYDGAVALDDSRHAIHAARALNIVPYGLAVGANEMPDLATLFGVGGYAMLRDVGRLPNALLRAVRVGIGHRSGGAR
jgi:nitric oxide reductase NorD protein